MGQRGREDVRSVVKSAPRPAECARHTTQLRGQAPSALPATWARAKGPGSDQVHARGTVRAHFKHARARVGGISVSRGSTHLSVSRLRRLARIALQHAKAASELPLRFAAMRFTSSHSHQRILPHLGPRATLSAPASEQTSPAAVRNDSSLTVTDRRHGRRASGLGVSDAEPGVRALGRCGMIEMRAAGRVGAFVCAKDDGSVLPLMLVHFNIVM